jgi:hypothetical protein
MTFNQTKESAMLARTLLDRFARAPTLLHQTILAAVLSIMSFNSIAKADPPIVHLSSDQDTPGVTGENTAGGRGVYGISSSGPGVFAVSAEYNGVLGESHANEHSGVAGVNKNDGNGVFGRSDGRGCGVYGMSEMWTGVYGRSSQFNGVLGESEAKGHSGVAGVNKKDGHGVYGCSEGGGCGVFGISNMWIGVYGRSSQYDGVLGESEANGHSGVAGINKKNGHGVYGRSEGHGNGVVGISAGKGNGVVGISPMWTGVYGESESDDHQGVVGVNKKNGHGVYGHSNGKGSGVHGIGYDGRGVSGESRAGPGIFGTSVSDHAVLGETQANERAGIAGINKSHGNGVYGRSDGQGIGVFGTSSSGRGVMGDSRNHDGVVGLAHVANKSGVVGLNEHQDGYGVWASSFQGTGLYAKGRTGALIGTDNGIALRLSSDSAPGDEPAAPLVEAVVSENRRVFSIGMTGQVSASSYQAAHSQVGESIELSETAESGDVVEIDPAAPGIFRLARMANSPAVAGVLVQSPGVALGADETASVERLCFLALTGRVSVKVSIENGNIHPGDLLVSSNTPGHAMKAPPDPKPGTVIGKALGNLLKDRGVTEMLVMLR